MPISKHTKILIDHIHIIGLQTQSLHGATKEGNNTPRIDPKEEELKILNKPIKAGTETHISKPLSK